MWIVLSLLNAIFSGAQNAYYKKADLKINPVLVTWSVLVVSSVLFLPLFLLGIPHIGPGFWPAVVGRVVLDSLATTLYVKAVQMSPLSLTAPMMSLWTVFVFFTQFFINHLSPSTLGILGVAAIVCGVYCLHFDHDTKHILSPFLNIYKEKGVLLIIIVCLVWSFVTALQRQAIDNSSPYFYTAFFQLFWAICFTPVAALIDRKGFRNLFRKRSIKQLAPAGLLDALQVFPQYIAYSLALPVYVNAVGNLSILFSSLFGWYFYKEKLVRHLVPTLIILGGVVLVTLAQG